MRTLFVLSTVGTMVALGCGPASEARDAIPATTAAATRVTVESVTADVPLELPSQLYVEHDAYVLARSTGVVDSVYHDLGDHVARGALLASLEHTDQAIALADAKAAAANADARVRRARELGRTGALTVQDSEQAELDAQRADLQLRQAQRDYDLTRIVAPFAGVVSARATRVGRLVQPKDSLFRVTALGPLLASVQLPERAPAVPIGADAEVVSSEGLSATAVVARESPTIDPASGTREVIVRVTGNTALRPGMAVQVRVGSERRPVLAIPSDALNEDGYVLVWDHGRATLRSVVLGASLPDGRVEVRSGLSAGESILRARAANPATASSTPAP